MAWQPTLQDSVEIGSYKLIVLIDHFQKQVHDPEANPLIIVHTHIQHHRINELVSVKIQR